MAGAKITITETGSAQAEKRLETLAQRGQELQPAMAAIGEYLLGSTQERIAAGISPDGSPFEPLSQVTLARKQKNQDKILIENGYLFNLVYQAGSDSLELGSNLIYAAMHQFGGTTAPNSMMPGKDIPARPYLGLGQEDERSILGILGEYLS